MGDWIVDFEVHFSSAFDARRALALKLGKFGDSGSDIRLRQTSDDHAVSALWVNKGEPSAAEMEGLAHFAIQQLRRTGLDAQPVTSVAYRPQSDIPEGIVMGIDPGDATGEEVGDFLKALSALHRAAGGAGLSFEIDGEQVVARLEELV